MLVGIKNVTKRRIYFSFGPGPWVPMVSWRWVRPARNGTGSSGANSQGQTHGPAAGRPFCHPPGTVFGLAPGATIFRDEEFPLTGFPRGSVMLTVFTQLLKAAPKLDCAPVEYHHGEAEVKVDIRN